MQELGGRLELLVLEQTPDERFARIFFGPGVFLRRIRARQQRARLDVNQRRRHYQELSRHVEIQVLHERDVAQVLLGDERDRDVVDVQLALANQVQEQIERSLKGVELDLIGVRRRFEVDVLVHVAA